MKTVFFLNITYVRDIGSITLRNNRSKVIHLVRVHIWVLKRFYSKNLTETYAGPLLVNSSMNTSWYTIMRIARFIISIVHCRNASGLLEKITGASMRLNKLFVTIIVTLKTNLDLLVKIRSTVSCLPWVTIALFDNFIHILMNWEKGWTWAINCFSKKESIFADPGLTGSLCIVCFMTAACKWLAE